MAFSQHREKVCAGLVHLLTASGAVFGLFALLAAAQGEAERCFAWLGVALIIDGIDGPLARRFEVKRVLPWFSGEDLDNVIDYFTYVAIPAFLLATGGLMPNGLSYLAAAVVMLVSLYHFGDKDSKTEDGYFVGFPAIWNLVVFYLFVMPLPPLAAFLTVMALAVLTFVPMKWVHPVRVQRFRSVTAILMAVWAAAAIASVASGFPGSLPIQLIFAATLFYGVATSLFAGIARHPSIKPAE